MLTFLLSSLSFPNHKTSYTKALCKYTYWRLNRVDEGKSFYYTPHRKQLNKCPIMQFLPKFLYRWTISWNLLFFDPFLQEALGLGPACSPSWKRKIVWNPEGALLLLHSRFISAYSKASLWLQRNSHTRWKEDSFCHTLHILCYFKGI